MGRHAGEGVRSAGLSPDWAVNCFAIRFLVHAHPFPPVFLVIKFESGAVGGQDEFVRHGFWETTKLSRFRAFVKCDVLHFKLDRLLGIVALAFDSVFSDAEEIIERY